jgi:hypothetical protein
VTSGNIGLDITTFVDCSDDYSLLGQVLQAEPQCKWVDLGPTWVVNDLLSNWFPELEMCPCTMLL